jgi:hypothetical protein
MDRKAEDEIRLIWEEDYSPLNGDDLIIGNAELGLYMDAENKITYIINDETLEKATYKIDSTQEGFEEAFQEFLEVNNNIMLIQGLDYCIS